MLGDFRSMHASLEHCDYRVPLTTDGMSFCRHAQVHSRLNIVSNPVCEACAWRAIPCAQPRDVPDELPTPAPKPPKVPPLYKRLSNFTAAAIGHVLKGCPTCSDEQITARLAVCQACPLFKPSAEDSGKGVCTHEKCGCGIGRGGAFLRKLAWQDQQCPLGKWRAIS